jgi:hypothetical protein
VQLLTNVLRYLAKSLDFSLQRLLGAIDYQIFTLKNPDGKAKPLITPPYSTHLSPSLVIQLFEVATRI